MTVEGCILRLPEELHAEVNTDVIIAGRYLRLPEEELAQHAFEGVIPNFQTLAKQRSILVAGRNMGAGSSREQAPKALLGAGIRLVLAESFGSIFFRNAINLGLPVLHVPNAVGLFTMDDEVVANLETGALHRRGVQVATVALPNHIMKILRAGGILPLLRNDPGALA